MSEIARRAGIVGAENWVDARELTDDGEKREALRLLCQRYAPDHMDLFDGAMAASLSRTAVWCIAVEEITGKSNRNNHR